MATNPNNIPIIPSREQLGLPQTDDARPDTNVPTVAVPAPGVIPTGQFDWIMSTIAKLEARLTVSERRTVDHRPPPRPGTDPPFAVPLSASAIPFSTPAPDAHWMQQPLPPAVIHSQIQRQPFLTSQGTNFPLHSGFQLPQPPTTHQFHNTTDLDFHGSFRVPPSHTQSWQNPLPNFPFDRQIHTPPLGPRPTSCWYPSPSHPLHGYHQPDQHKSVRMDPPRFDGTDTANWIFKIQYYFDHMMMPDAHRLHYVVPLFDPPAAEWIKHYCSNNDFVTWQDFLNDVRYRFDPDCYESYIGLIAKLCQTGTVSDYQLEFERLQNKLSGVPDYILLPIYIAGLKQPLQREVKLHRPSTLAAAFALAKELSACRPEHQQSTYTSERNPSIPRESRAPYSISPAPNYPNAASSSQVPHPSGGQFRELSKLPVVRLSASEKADRSRRGLCWYCEDKWAPGHVCNHNFLAYMGVDADEDDVVALESDFPDDNGITSDLSHLNAVEGQQHLKSFNIVGTIHKSAVNILVDNGSSHDFIHPCIAEKLSLSLTKIKPFRVYVGNGASLVCSHVSKETVVDLQGNLFQIDLYILDIHGPNIILGMEWLESLGRVTHDYLARTMEFFRDDSLVVLRGGSFIPHTNSVHALAVLLSHMGQHDMFKIVVVPPSSVPAHSDKPPVVQADLSSPILRSLSDLTAVFRQSEVIQKRKTAAEWSGVDQPSPICDPITSLFSRFPYLFLEDKDDPIGGGVDKNPT